MSPAPLTVLHTSDYQVGRPYLPDAADAMVELAESVRPDVVVASGDLTQRAKRREFEGARELLDRFGSVPVVITPGNHDVPVYRALERLASPYRNWRRFSGSSELDTVTRVEGATFVALSSAAPYRAVVAGRLRARQMAFAHDAFRQAPVGDHRIVVVHHHFVPVEGGGAGRPLAAADELLEEFEAMGLSAILGGHVHQLHLRSSARLTGSAGSVPVLSTGTATSRRGRGAEAAANTLCVLRFTESEVEVTPYRRGVGEGAFQPMEVRTFGLSARVERLGGVDARSALRDDRIMGQAEKAAAS
ncbi:MAG: metallophosphoesterase [Gemmatimonadetes bacterium]|nr:metallophosphoesterase [Gemmatimonadota bacterium]NNL29422.1 metallophosphoesterase [Gemmatimonadota bacterium]